MGSNPGNAKHAARIGSAFALLLISLASASTASAQYPSQSQISKDGTAVLLEDYAELPLSSPTHGSATNAPTNANIEGQLGRATSLRSEPAKAPLSASRFFVIDESATIYIFDKNTKEFTPYLKFSDIFPKFVSDAGLATGVNSIAFDPDYAKNGKFYTMHIEKPTLDGPATPSNSKMPSLDLTGYTVTPADQSSGRPGAL